MGNAMSCAWTGNPGRAGSVEEGTTRMVASGQITRLRRDDFSFHGFDHLETELDAVLDDVWLRRGEPVAEVVSDAVFVPLTEVERGRSEGGMVTADGAPIPTAISHRRFGAFGHEVLGTMSQPLVLSPERVVKDEVVYLGQMLDHFGHLLLETLSRAWILDQVDPATKIVCHVQGALKLSGPAWRMLARFGITRERLLVLDTQTRLRRVIVPEALYEISYAAHDRLADAYRATAARIVRTDHQTDQPVYLSRRLLSSQQRPIVGELALEDVFRENGFLVAHTETMSFDDQVRLICRHRHVFSSTGSAAYLALFATRPPELHMLSASIPFHDYFLVPRAIGAAASFCNCFTGDNQPSHYYLPPVLELDKLADYLAGRGLLKHRTRAALTARALDFRPIADELRLYAFVRNCAVLRRRLPPEVEAEALTVAEASWPLLWMLARYYVAHDPARIEALIQQFNRLLAAETTTDRLARFQADVRSRNGLVLRHLQPETAADLTRVMLDRLHINFDDERARRLERREQGRRRNPGAAATPAGSNSRAKTMAQVGGQPT